MTYTIYMASNPNDLDCDDFLWWCSTNIYDSLSIVETDYDGRGRDAMISSLYAEAFRRRWSLADNACIITVIDEDGETTGGEEIVIASIGDFAHLRFPNRMAA